MTTPASLVITRLLLVWRDGDEEALEQLAPPAQGELRRMTSRYLRTDEIAAELKISPRIVMREWRLAPAWLYVELRSSEQPSGGQVE
jgi:hypothetical protein